MSSKLTIPKDWMTPLIMRPWRQHRQTLIVLHVRDDSAEGFAPVLLRTPFALPSTKPSADPQARQLCAEASSTEHMRKPSAQPNKLVSTTITTIENALPHAKFIFLAAPMRACTMLSGAENRQWFDKVSLINPETRQDLQKEGLRETVSVAHQLINNVLHDLGKENQLALLGFSQGAAASLISGLLWNANHETQAGPKAVTAIVAMSGWLPFRSLLEGTDESNAPLTRLERLRTTLESGIYEGEEATGAVPLSPTSIASILLCHGRNDRHVNPSLSRTAARALNDLGVQDVRESTTA